MSICSNICSFVLPFNFVDFCTLTGEQYASELEKAKNRALYIMLTSCQAKNPGWGISQEDFTNDESGQLQVVLELLTSAEFLRRRFGLGALQKTGAIGATSYSSPTGESLSLSADQLDKWLSLESFLRQEAWDSAYPYMCDEIKNGEVGPSVLLARNYDWQTLEAEYHTTIYPQYRHGKPYINYDFWGNVNFW